MTDPTAPERAWQDIIGSELYHSDSHNSIGSVREFGFALSRPILFCSVDDSQWIKTHSGEWHQHTFAEAPATNVAKANVRTESDRIVAFRCVATQFQ